MSNHWSRLKLQEVLTLQRGHDLTDWQRREGIVPVMSAAGHYGYHDTAIARGPGVVIGRSGASIGQVHFCESDFWPHNTALYVTSFHRNDARFIYYFLQSLNLSRFNSGGAQPSLNRNFIYPLDVLLPERSEQEVIASALSDVDRLLGALEALIEKKRAIKQATMQQLLTGKTRLPNFQGKWVTKRLGELATIKDGTHQTPKYVDAGIPFYSVEHVTSGDFRNTKFISEEQHRLLSRSAKIEKGDVLMTRIGSIGDCKLVDWEVNASFYVSLALLKIDSAFSARFIADYSNTAAFKKEVELRSLQSAIPKKINLGPISDIKIELPPKLDEQKAIALVLADMDSEIASLETRRDKTAAIKQGMMQQLLTGRIRLVKPQPGEAEA